MKKRTFTKILALLMFLSFSLAGLRVGAQEAKSPQKDEKKAATASEAGPEKKGDEKVATVNGVVIGQNEFDRAMERIQQRMTMMGQTPTPEQIGEMKKNVLDNLIDTQLLSQQAEKEGIQIGDKEISDQIDSLKKRFPSEKDFEETLKKANMSENDLKSQARQELMIKKLIDQQVVSKITIADNETKAYYESNPNYFKAPEQVCARHVLIKTDPKADEATKKKAHEKILEIQKKLKEGGDFEKLAKENSDCPSKEKGGDLGCFQKGQMVGPFEEVAFKLKPNELSDVVETQFGYHLIKVYEKKEARTIPYDEVKEKIEQYLKREQTDKQLTAYLDQLKQKAKIETFLKEEPKKPAKEADKGAAKQTMGKEAGQEAAKPAKQ